MNPFTKAIDAQAGSLGESILITCIKNWLGTSSPQAPRGIGDDCAAIPLLKSKPTLLMTADPIVYLKHFDDSVTPKQAAAKLLRRNISDIASMGGEPKHALISLSFPTTLSIDWLQNFYRGISDEALAYGIEVNGGDICETSDFLGAFLTLIGLAGKRVLQRNQTVTGSHIFVTGSLGGSRNGKHYDFVPRLAEGQWLAKRQEPISCLDLSDGLGKDCRALLSPKQSAQIDCSSIPISDVALEFSKTSGRTPIDHAMNDGEDYELLFTMANKSSVGGFESEWKDQFDTPLTCIGKVVERSENDEPIVLMNSSSRTDLTGYAHFGNP